MPRQITHPGVYVEEIPGGARPIAGVPTSITAFIGSARKGPLNKAVRVQSFSEFVRKFGNLLPTSELGYGVRQFFLNGGADTWVVRVARDATAAKMQSGLRALDAVDLFNLLVLPGVTDREVLAAAADYCRQRRALLIIDSPASAKTPADMQQVVATGGVPSTSYAAMYFPWTKILDPESQTLRSTPPSGTMAGVIARTDAAHGVWKAPAGKDATLNGVEALEYNLTDLENGVLNPEAINCLRMFPVVGFVAWGARTREGADRRSSEWKYIPVRRLALFIEESIYRGTQWAVFEPNDEPLWAKIRQHVDVFLQALWKQGAFVGHTPRESYYLKCDRETTTAQDVVNGIVNIQIGFAPLKPAEFVVIRIQHKLCVP